MAINPALVTTVQVSELPPNPLSPTSLFPHQVGDILSQADIQQLVDYIRSQSVSLPYETKLLTIPQSEATEYINTNFDMTIGATQGIGKTDGLWNGWAIHNGNNGTYNLDGQTLIGYGANYATVGQFVGSETHTLTTAQIPAHFHHTPGSVFKSFVSAAGDKTGNVSSATGYDSGSNTELAIGNLSTNYNSGGAALEQTVGSGQAHNNMQPSMVCLMIYKLP